MRPFSALDRIALALAIVGALNWGLVGLFQFDLVAALFGGQSATIARVVYSLVGLAGLYCLTLLFRTADAARGQQRALGPVNRP